VSADDREALAVADRWILSRLEALVTDVRAALDRYEFNVAAGRLYEFLWHEYCDWYLELSKLAFGGGDPRAAEAARVVLATVFETTLRLLHPIMPFITEELWQALPLWVRRREGETASSHIAVARFPTPRSQRHDPAAETTMERLIQIVRGVRNLRAEVGLPPGTRLGLGVYAPDAGVRAEITESRALIENLARVDGLEVHSHQSRPEGALLVALDGMELYVPVAGVIDVAAERARLERELEKVTRDLTAVEKKLQDERFLDRAPSEVVDKERDREAGLRERRATIERGVEQLRRLGADA
jgi:valyl-tRNA synthetase